VNRLAIFIFLIAYTIPAKALNWELGDFTIDWVNRVAIGAAWRIEERDPDLIGKRNLDPTLCLEHDCQSLTGDASRNQELVDAPGGFFAHNQDDGNLNYDKGDPVAGVAKLTSDLRVFWGDYTLKTSAIAFYDTVNTGFENRHPNTLYQPARTPRDDSVEELVGKNVELYDLAISRPFSLWGIDGDISIGQQTLRWGESNLIGLNTLNEINPPDARRLRQPTVQPNELFLPVPLAVLSADILPEFGISAEVFYQFGWRPAIGDPAGSFFSSTDILYRDNAFSPIGLGYQPEDPEGKKRISNPIAALLTNTSFTTRILDQEIGYPEDGGQYGLRVNWYTENVLGGTEFGFYAMNYHSRLPYLSYIAAQNSCLRDATGNSYVELIIACEGFKLLGGKEALPVDTIRGFLEYPEDIHLFGTSFNTTLAGWSVSGEYAYRPNLPVQVAVPDIGFAALTPAFPEEDIVISLEGLLLAGNGGGPVDQLLAVLLDPLLGPLVGGYPFTIPGASNAVPNFIETSYRGNTIQPGQTIHGYERLSVHQWDVTAVKILGNSNPVVSFLGSEQIIFLAEIGANYIDDLPGLDEIQFDGGSPNRTHYSPGADGTGQPDGRPDPRSQNPTQQTTAFVTDWSWGYRMLARLEYNDVFAGINLKPFGLFLHDVSGWGPSPMQNFLEDRKIWVLGLEGEFGQAWTAKIQYAGMDGSRHFSTRDRDNIALEISYTF